MTADPGGDRRRVLVAGTNYGRFYVRALELPPQRHRLCALMALGSDRSQQAADQLGVPLVRGIGDLDSWPDLVCWAVGQSGEAAAMEILRSGVPMLCEHPIGTAFLDRALDAAAGAPLHVNGHFADLAVPRCFLESARRHGDRPLAIAAAATDRSLYACLDLLSRYVAMDDLVVDRAGDWDGFRRVIGTVDGVPLEVAVQVGDLPDGSPAYRVDIRVELSFVDGVLALDSVAGPVRWRKHEATADDAGTVLVSGRSPAGQEFLDDRVAANRRAVDDLVAELGGAPTPPHQRPERLRAVSRAWESVAGCLGQSSE